MRLPVTHVLEAYRGAELWGKERLVESLMLAQRASGEIEPRLITFTPGALADSLREQGFAVATLETAHRRLPTRSLPALRRTLAAAPPALVHTHGYKANLVGRLLKITGTRMRGLVATAHGWPDESRSTALYNALDRWTAALSDVTTVPDQRMLARFPARGRQVFVPNGIADSEPASLALRESARARFGFPANRIVFGFLGRASAAKGILELLAAARETLDEPFVWAIAGAGELDATLAAAALPNVRFLGYVPDSQTFLAAVDVFVQVSHSEGLSLALLEAMRAARPVVATDVGSTALAVRDGIDGFIIPPRDSGALLARVRALATDPVLAARYGAAARSRFADSFRSERQHRAFLEIYRTCGRER